IQELLCGLPNLKEFFVLGAVQLHRRPDPSLKASDLVASQWVCTNLKVFGCTIKGVPRPDTKQQHGGGGNHSSKTKAYQESIHLQRQVCTQFGRLTKLRELILRAPYPIYDTRDSRRYNEHHSHDCLAMSLEGGLDLLHGLRGLRKVGLEDMDVEIGNPAEQEWVKAKWPHATIQYPGNAKAGPRIPMYENYDSDNDSNASRTVVTYGNRYSGFVEYDYDWQEYLYIDEDGFMGSYEPDYGDDF
ncbi:hypothetical protein BGZ95_000454, partial [Linnemannia exigua]